jgi:hypothetical protein
MSDEKETARDFPAEVYVNFWLDGDDQYISVSETLEDVSPSDCHDGRLAVYKLVREGTVKQRPSTVKFIPNKGTK